MNTNTILKIDVNTQVEDNGQESILNFQSLAANTASLYSTKFPISLTNHLMHSLNGNNPYDPVMAVVYSEDRYYMLPDEDATLYCITDNGTISDIVSLYWSEGFDPSLSWFGNFIRCFWLRFEPLCCSLTTVDYESMLLHEYNLLLASFPRLWFYRMSAYVDFYRYFFLRRERSFCIPKRLQAQPQVSTSFNYRFKDNSKSKKRVKFVYRKTFQEWFKLTSNESNLSELRLAWSKHVERYIKRTRFESSNFSNLEILINCYTKFSVFKSTLHSHTINRVESSFLKPEATPQMGFWDGKFDVNVNHHAPGVVDFGNGLYDLLPESAKMDPRSLEMLNMFNGEIFIWVFFSFLIYGYSKCCRDVPWSYYRICQVLIPAMCLTKIAKETDGIIESLNEFMRVLAASFSSKSLDGFEGDRNDVDITMTAIPQMETESLVDAAGVLYSILSLKVFGLKTPESALKQISAFWHARPAIEDFIVKASSLCESVVNSYVTEYTESKPFRFLSSRSAIFQSFESECDILFTAFNKNEIVPTTCLYDQVHTLERRMKIAYSTMSKNKDLVGSARLFYQELQKVEKIRIFLMKRTSASLSLRVEPVVVMIHGDPGVGKSLTTQYLAKECAVMDSSPEERETISSSPLAYQFVRFPEAFWTGYMQDTKVTILDDFDQTKDMPGIANSTFSEFIQMCSSAVYPLPMAHLEEKGGVFFKSRFVIANTNTDVFRVESIRSAEAVNRRININVVCAPRPQYCTDETCELTLYKRRLDKSKLPVFTDENGDQCSKLTPQCQEFYFVGTSGKFDDLIPVRYDELVSKIRDLYKLKGLWHRSMLAEFNSPTSADDYDLQAGLKSENNDDDTSEVSARCKIYRLLKNNDSKSVQTLDIINQTYIKAFKPEKDFLLESALEDLYSAYSEEYIDEALERAIEFGEEILLSEPIREITPISTYSYNFKKIFVDMKHLASRSFTLGSKLLNQFVEFVTSKTFAQFSLLLSSMVGAYGLYRLFSSDTQGKPQSVGFTERGGKKKPREKWIGRKDFDTLLHKASPQIGHPIDSSGASLLTSIARKNLFVVYYESGYNTGTFAKSGLAIAVKGRFVLTHYHFITKLASMVLNDEQYSLARIRFVAYDSKGWVREFRVTDIFKMFANKDPQIPEKDLCVIEMPSDFQPRADIIKNFALTKDGAQFQKNLDYLLITYNDSPNTCTGIAQAMDTDIVVGSDWAGSWKIRKGYEYKAATTSGDCGSLFCVMNPGVQNRKIFGIHVAVGSYTKLAYAESITQEEIYAKIEELGEDIVSHIDNLDLAVPEIGSYVEQSQFNVIGELAPNRVPPSTTRTSIIKSCLFNYVSEPTCVPAKLKPFMNSKDEYKDPFEIAKSKTCVNIASVPRYQIDKVCENLFAHLENVSSEDVERRLLTEEEVLYGKEGSDVLRGMNTSTSAGYPYTLPNVYCHKTTIFSFEKDSLNNLQAREILKNYIDTLIEKLSLNERVETFYTWKMKDQKIKIEKCDEGKGRAFNMSPFHHFFMTKMYFGAFCSWIALNRITNGMTGGVNVYSEEWHILALKLGPKGVNKGAGDFSAFDGSHLAAAMWFILDYINKWYSDGNDVVRSGLFLEIVNARVIDGNLLVEWSHGLPSGTYLTFVLNSLLNHVYHGLCWISMGQAIHLFYIYVYLVVHGDDSLFSVDPLYSEIFNEITLEEHMSYIGMKYTSELKEVSLVPSRPLSEVGYLKRTFRFDAIKQKYLAPLQVDAILEPINWSKSKDFFAITASNLEIALRELSLHDKETFLKYQPRIVAGGKKLKGVKFTYPLESSYETWQELVCKDEELM